MNRGTMRGFTWQTLPSDATYPEMKVVYLPYQGGDITLGSTHIDTLLLLDSPSSFNVELSGAGMKEGQCIHIAQWGSNQVTFTNADGVIRCALIPTTRAQFSVLTAMFINAQYNEFLVFGDMMVVDQG